MKFLNFKILILVIISYVLIYPLKSYSNQIPRKFPSLMVSLLAGGGFQEPTDPETIQDFISLYGSADVNSVKRWEVDNADFVTNLGMEPSYLQKTRAMGYIYIHTNVLGHDYDRLVKWAIRNGKNYEDFSLHYTSDTIINTTVIGATNTFWMGVVNAGYSSSATGYGSPISSSGSDVFSGSETGGGFFIWAPLPFHELNIVLTRNGEGNASFVVECPTSVNSDFTIATWSPVTVVHDGTNGFTRSGTIRILPRSDWKYANLYPPRGFYSPYLVNGGGSYVLRIRATGFTVRPLVSGVSTSPAMEYLDGEPYLGVANSGFAQSGTIDTITLASFASSSNDAYRNHLVKIVSGTGAGQVRVVTSYSGSTRVATVDRSWNTIPDNTSQYKVVRRVVRIRGWDAANDRNGDGYIDDSEYANLANPNATARMRHFSRLIYTNAWVSFSAWDVANVFNADYQQAISEIIRDSWQSRYAVGGYIDDVAGNGLGRLWVNRHRAVSPAVLQGGYLHEYRGGRVDQDDPTGIAWFDGYIANIQRLKQVTGSSWVGGNAANENLHTSYYASRLVGVLDWFLCEDTLKYSPNVDWWGGLMLRPGWIYPAIAARGSFSMLYAHHDNYSAYGINTRETWEYRTKHLLAFFYMINVPDKMSLRIWNHSFWYDNFNTTASDYWKPGVPKTYAYHPWRLLKVDIGVPENTIPEGKQPMHLKSPIMEGYSRRKIGDSTLTQLALPDGKVIPTIPTYIYVLRQIGSGSYRDSDGLWIPHDAVYARNYTKGLVLLRLKYEYAIIPNYENSSEIVELPGVYRVLNYDGTLGPPITQVSIKGGEGIILVKADQVAQIQPKISITIDKTNPKINQPTKLNIQIANREGISSLERILNLENRLITKGSIKINNTIFSDFISNLFQVISNILNLNIPVILNLETIGR